MIPVRGNTIQNDSIQKGNRTVKKNKSKPKRNLNLEDWEEWSDEDIDFEEVTDMEDSEEDEADDRADIDETDEDGMDDDEPDDDYSEYRDALEDKKRFNWHYLFLIVIVLLLGLVIFKIYQWNKGTASDYDPNHIDTSFDSEVLDVVFPLMPDAQAAQKDDGVQTILCLGNDTFADDRDSKDSLTAMIAEKAAAKDLTVSVINGSFAGTTISNEDQFITDDTLSDMFNLYWVVTALCEQDFTYQRNALTKVEGDNHYAETIDELEALDMSAVDTLVLFYDGSDYQKDRHVTDPSYEMNTSTYVGALSSSLKLFQETYPQVRIIVLSPTYMQFVDENGDAQNGDTYNIGNGALPNSLLNLIDVTQEYSVTVIDNYYGTISEDNYKKYLDDAIHLNKKGRDAIADRLVAVLE